MIYRRRSDVAGRASAEIAFSMTNLEMTDGHFEIKRQGGHELLIAKTCREVENGRWQPG